MIVVVVVAESTVSGDRAVVAVVQGAFHGAEAMVHWKWGHRPVLEQQWSGCNLLRGSGWQEWPPTITGRREVFLGAEHTHGLAEVELWRRMMVEVRERSSLLKSFLCRCTSLMSAWISRSNVWYSRRVVAASLSSSSMPVTLAASRALLPPLLTCPTAG